MRIDITLSTFLTIIFVVLKLTDVITWSWIWVFSPLWLTALVFVSILAVVFVVSLVASIFKQK